jgi:hypothetical protein
MGRHIQRAAGTLWGVLLHHRPQIQRVESLVRVCDGCTLAPPFLISNTEYRIPNNEGFDLVLLRNSVFSIHYSIFWDYLPGVTKGYKTVKPLMGRGLY